MISSIRNNRRERKSKLEKLKNTSNNREKKIDPIKASPELLRNIRIKLQLENKSRNQKAVIKTGILLFILLIIIYLLNKYWYSIIIYLK